MSRASGVWWNADKKCYYTYINRKKTRLAPTLAAAKTKLQQILKGGTPSTDQGITFASVADQFLDHSQAENEPPTYEVHRFFLQSFRDHVKNRPVARLVEADLDKWCRSKPTWNENTRARAKAIVLAVLNFGVKKLGLPSHPLKHVRPGTVGRRERYLTPEERGTIRQTVKGCFAEYVMALEQTGARPFSEICRVTAADVNLQEGTITLAKWKNSKKKKGVKRIIYLTPPMVELVRTLMERHPEGPLFRNNAGTPWIRQSITWRFRNLSEKLQLPDITAYSMRHAYISDALVRGVPVAIVAELCGTSIQTINKHYAHIDKKHDALREAARRAVGS